jgi:hypothetical protein
VPATTDRAARAWRRTASLCASAALWLACTRPTLLPRHGNESPEIQAACHRTELRCSSCHSLDRVLSSPHRGRPDWEEVVKQMRLRPGSGITVGDGDMIVRCLTYVDATRSRAASCPRSIASALAGELIAEFPTRSR